MLDWQPIKEFPQAKMGDNTTYLLWCPDLRVSGPAVTAYRSSDCWLYALTGFAVETAITHYAEINEPNT
jgi:hypothetical protein